MPIRVDLHRVRPSFPAPSRADRRPRAALVVAAARSTILTPEEQDAASPPARPRGAAQPGGPPACQTPPASARSRPRSTRTRALARAARGDRRRRRRRALPRAPPRGIARLRRRPAKNASYDAAEGFGLRAVRGETAGYAHATEISEAALRRAAETARLAVGAGGGTLAAEPKATNQRLYTDRDPFDDAGVRGEGRDAARDRRLRPQPRPPRRPGVRQPRRLDAGDRDPSSRGHALRRGPARWSASTSRSSSRRTVAAKSGSAGGGGRTGLAPLMGTDHWKEVAREALRIATVNLARRAGARPG